MSASSSSSASRKGKHIINADEDFEHGCGFVRVSTQDQSLKNQEKLVRKYAEDNNITLDRLMTLKGTGYQCSYTKNLPAYMRRLCKGGTQHIIVHSADRLARSVVAFVELIRSLPKHVKLHFIVDNLVVSVGEFFPATPAACDVFKAIAEAETYSAILGAKIRRTRALLKSIHPDAYLGGAIPLGKMTEIRVDDEENEYRVLVEDPEYRDVAKLLAWLSKTKKVRADKFANILNSRSIYLPFWRQGRREYLCWNLSLVVKTHYENLPGRVKPTVFHDVTFNMIDMEMELGEEDSEYMKILETGKISGKHHSKLQWRQPQPDGSVNISWIPTENL